MPIDFCEKTQVFHLYNHSISYGLKVSAANHLLHAYWGRRLHSSSIENQSDDMVTKSMAFKPENRHDGVSYDLESAPQEYPAFGSGDSRVPGFKIMEQNGYRSAELLVRRHHIQSGKLSPEGLPATYAEEPEEAHSLVVTLADAAVGLEVDLVYTVFRDHDAIARHSVIRNVGSKSLVIEKASSAVLHFSERDFDLISLPGAWARERELQSRPLGQGLQGVESRRGASSHSSNPFFALSSNACDENHGEVYGFSLIYSGNFEGQVEVAMDDSTRALIGLGSFDFSWKLNSREEFSTPEAVLVYSCAGLGSMSRTFHRLYRERLCRGKWRDVTRPVLLNNWEATYFHFDRQRLTALAREAHQAGLEMFVLDDGWFGKRDDGQSSLGDWVVNETKCGGDLKGFGQELKGLGLRFGLWFEPEMVSPDSELYRAHPDWFLGVPGREQSLVRHQLMLDFSRKEVCGNIISQLSKVLSAAPIDYVKWDFNRNVTEIGSGSLEPQCQKELWHRYYLGLYGVLECLNQRFPHILFESCSGGGGRFDPGMLYYMPQTWTSDNSDAISRLKIQYGTSLVYPLSSMGSHVSDCPNHQVYRNTPWETRSNIAFFGTFGYELDLCKHDGDLKNKIRRDVQRFKSLAPTIHGGDFYRLQSPFEWKNRAKGNEVSWICVSPDRRKAVLFWIRILEIPNKGIQRLKLMGLDEAFVYEIDELERSFGGDELMFAGLRLPEYNHGDFNSRLYVLKAL
jgi:alpha-galactosidase